MNNPKQKDNIKLLVFLEGFLVLALQILVSVMVTPYWGNSFVFWSLSLFFTMLALSIGYFMTPFVLSKTKNKASALLVKLLWVVSIYLLFIFSQAENILVRFITDYTSLIAGNIVTLLVFIFIPVLCLAMIPILVINHQNSIHTLEEGTATGKVFSLSSLSGILAVVLISFVMIPLGGILITQTIILCVVFLVFFTFLWGLDQKLSAYILTLVFAFGLAFLNLRTDRQSSNPNVRLIEQTDGLLGQIKVVDYLQEKTRHFYVNNASQSKIHATGRSLFPYIYAISIYASYKPAGSDVLIAGMGGGSLVYELSEFDYNIDVVDIDARLESLVERHSLVPAKKANFIESDIRRYVNNSQKKYDIIILDLSKGESVPTNVYTNECFTKTKQMLKKDGIILIHFLSSLTEDGQLALASVGKTLRSTGLDYRLMNRFNKKSLLDGQTDLSKPNGYIFCAAEQIDFSEAAFKIDPSIIESLIPQKENLFLEFNDKKGLVLTDDKPILDVIQQENVSTMRKMNIKSLIGTEGYE